MNTILTITGLGALAMLAEILRWKKILYPVIIAGIAAALLVNSLDWNTFVRHYNDMLFMDNFAISFSGLLLGIVLLWFLISGSYYSGMTSMVDNYTIILFALVGGLIMVSYADLSMLFIGLEILSISFYILASSDKQNLRSNEAGIKYFLMGAFATGFFLFGIALIYGAGGTFNLQELGAYVSGNAGSLPGIFYAGVLMMLVGMTFKISAVPFHFWAPDVYEGSPTPVTALMSTLVKAAAFAALYRLFTTCFIPVSTLWQNVFWVMAAASMLTGNILAVSQASFKRMLAYSSIAHAGYMLMALVAINELAAPSLLLYAAAYSVASVASFAILQIISRQTGDERIEGLKGLAKSNPFVSGVLVFIMLSLAGIPPMAGFFAKYYLFYATLSSGFTGLVLIAVISSLIGVYYYLRVIITLFQKPDKKDHEIEFSPYQILFLGFTAFLILLVGIAPNLITGLFH